MKNTEHEENLLKRAWNWMKEPAPAWAVYLVCGFLALVAVLTGVKAAIGMLLGYGITVLVRNVQAHQDPDTETGGVEA